MSNKTKQKNIQPQEVWMAKFPFEENPSITKIRPVVVLAEVDSEDLSVLEINTNETNYLSVKVTSHEKRDYDDYDTPIVKWRVANLNKESIARVSKTINLPKSQFVRKLGIADDSDFENILIKYLDFIDG